MNDSAHHYPKHFYHTSAELYSAFALPGKMNEGYLAAWGALVPSVSCLRLTGGCLLASKEVTLACMA